MLVAAGTLVRESAQIQIIGVETIGPLASRALDLGLAKRRLDDTSGANRDLVLELENVLQ